MASAVANAPDISIFEITSDSEDIAEWTLEPMPDEYLSDRGGFFLVRATHVRPDGTINSCWIDMTLPERISDHAYFIEGSSVQQRYLHEVDGEVICAVAIDEFGVYDLFYSRIAPELGIDVLRSALAVAPRKVCIAEDLGYILRDENRYTEAAEAFEIAILEGPSSEYIYGEIAGCYREIGETTKADEYQKRFEESGMSDIGFPP